MLVSKSPPGPGIYLDNCATTPLDPEVAAVMLSVMTSEFGNPSSIHHEGRRAANRLNEARVALAAKLGARPAEIVFTSSGTEANNTAIGGVILHALRNTDAPVHIITTATEHASVARRLDYEKRLHGNRVEVTPLPVSSEGLIDPADLQAAVQPNTILATILHANNETGALQDLEVLKSFKLRNPSILLHLDIVQSFCKVALDVRLFPADLLTACAHKLHGPKGAGFLFVRAGIPLEPMLVGGGQEKYRRAGTENVAAAAGFAAAVLRAPAPDPYQAHLLQLEHSFFTALEPFATAYRLNGPATGSPNRIPGLFNLSFTGAISREDLQIALDLEGVRASSASACHSGVIADSHVLVAMGVPAPARAACIRVAFSRIQTAEEATQAGQIVGRVVQRMQAIVAPSVS